MTTKAQNARLSFELTNVVKDPKKGSFSFRESIDYSEPTERVLAKSQLAAHFLFNSLPVPQATRLFQFAIEKQVEINPNLMARVKGLTVEAKITGHTSYWTYLAALTKEQTSFMEKAATAYLEEYFGGVNLSALLLNDGSWEAGQLVKITGKGVTGQIGIVVSALEKGPITILMGKQGNAYLYDQLLQCDKNVVIDAAKLPDEFVTGLRTMRAKMEAEGKEEAEGAKEKSDRLGKKANEAYDKLWAEAQKVLAKLHKAEDELWAEAHADLADYNFTHDEEGNPNGKEAPKRAKKAKKEPASEPNAKQAKDEPNAEKKATDEPKAEPQPEAQPQQSEDERRANLDPTQRKGESFTLTGHEQNELKGLVKNIAKLLHESNFIAAPKEEREWASETLKLSNAAKDKRNVWYLRRVYGEVKAKLGK